MSETDAEEQNGQPLIETILIADDDETIREQLARALANRGYEVRTAEDGNAALEVVRQWQADGAVVDLKMPGMGGLELVKALLDEDPEMRIVIHTGYGSIATALEATRNGATDYLTKPADADQILAAMLGKREQQYSGEGPQVEPPSLDRVEWEHIQRILTDCGGNISKAAKVLGIHRRSLQRKLSKYPPTR
jgi:two-component system response regulator RegA